MNVNSFVYTTVVLFLVYLTITPALAAEAPVIEWQKVLGGSGYDYGGGGIQQTSDGGYILIGDTESSSSGDVGAFRPSVHTIYLKNGTTTTAISWGVSTDLPVTANWNENGRTDVGVFRPSAHTFYLKNGTTTTAINWGTSTDKPVTGKW
jgi:hypothetical protein